MGWLDGHSSEDADVMGCLGGQRLSHTRASALGGARPFNE